MGDSYVSERLGERLGGAESWWRLGEQLASAVR